MVSSNEDLESNLTKLERRFERTEDNTFLVSAGPGQTPIAVRLEPPVVVVQVGIGPAPSGSPEREASVFRRLLELNAGDLLHAAYGLENGTIVLSAALEQQSLDLNELEAVLADMAMALTKHVPELHKLVQKDG